MSNVFRLGDVAEIEAQKLVLLLMFNWKTTVEFSTEPAILPNRCWAMYYFFGKLNPFVYSFIKASTSLAVLNLSPSITIWTQNRLFCNASKATYGLPFVTFGKRTVQISKFLFSLLYYSNFGTFVTSPLSGLNPRDKSRQKMISRDIPTNKMSALFLTCPDFSHPCHLLNNYFYKII